MAGGVKMRDGHIPRHAHFTMHFLPVLMKEHLVEIELVRLEGG
jgi:hypothetical protein